MRERRNKIIITIEAVLLIIASTFVASMLGGNTQNRPPIASASANITSGKTPLDVTFEGSALDSDGDVVSYLWDFGDGTISESQNPTHVYERNGKYIVTLTVKDNRGNVGKNNIIINALEDTSPEIITTSQEKTPDYIYVDVTWSPEYPDPGEKITFYSNYYDYYYFGMITNKIWNFGDGSSGSGSIVTHTYEKKGQYRVTLTVFAVDIFSGNTSQGYSSDYITIGASPFPRFTWSPEEPTTGENVNFDASESWDTDNQELKYNWTFTESSEPDKIIEMGNNKTFTYRWNIQGNYNVKLAVSDEDNNTNEITKNIIVSILSIQEVTSSHRHMDFQITNRGNITAKNIKWTVYVNRKFLMIPLWKIFNKTGVINTLGPGESESIDIGRYRRGFGRITMTITIQADNAVKITETLQGSMFGKFIRLRSW